MKYVIRAITVKYENIELTVTNYVPPQAPEPPEPETEPEPDPLTLMIPETDEERVMLKLLKAARKFGYDPFPRTVHVRAPVMRMSFPLSESKISLSTKEYDEIGKPGIGQILELTIKKVEVES